MKLGRKARYLLEMMAAVGAETALGVLFPHRTLLSAGGWNEDRYLVRRFQDLKDRGLLDFEDGGKSGGWIVKLSKTGKNALRGVVDPEIYWARRWDGAWRLVGFDLPAKEALLRRDLLRWLKERRFGRLQDSLWVSPCFEEEWYEELSNLEVDPSAASFVEGKSFARSSDRDFVDKAWDFGSINGQYQELIDFHDKERSWGGGVGTEKWLKKEIDLWLDVFEKDPFLPIELLPNGYLGQRAYDIRKRTYLGIAGS